MYKIIYSVFLIIFTTSVQAIVNIEKINIKTDENAMQGEFGLDFSGATGNSDIEAVAMAGRLQWNNRSTQFVVLKYEYAKSEGVLSADKTFFHYRYVDQADARISPEVFLQVENDEFKLLKLRALVGAGYRFKLHTDNKDSHSRLGLGLFYSEEEYNDVASSTEQVTRLNLYYTYQLKLKNSVNFITTTYYQPDLENTSDFRALEQLSFEFSLSDDLLYFITVDISYDNDPVDQLDKNDTSYKSGIKYRF